MVDNRTRLLFSTPDLSRSKQFCVEQGTVSDIAGMHHALQTTEWTCVLNQPVQAAPQGEGDEAYRGGLVSPDPDLGLLEEEETVDQHAGDRDETQAKGDTPDGIQGVVVVLAAGLSKNGQQNAQDGCVDQVSPPLHIISA